MVKPAPLLAVDTDVLNFERRVLDRDSEITEPDLGIVDRHRHPFDCDRTLVDRIGTVIDTPLGNSRIIGCGCPGRY